MDVLLNGPSVCIANNVSDLAATLILDDNVDGAEAGLDKGVSSFHKVCALCDLSIFPGTRELSI